MLKKIHTFGIIVLLILYTLNTVTKAVIWGLFGKPKRQWVNHQLQLWAHHVIKALKTDCKVINPLHIEPQKGVPTIVMCNHSSLFDIPLSFLVFPKHSLRMLAKREMSKLPLMNKAMILSEFPFIDRKNRRQAIEDLKHVKSLLESGIVMWIAPEGTRSKDGALKPFKKGGFITAIETNATIIPIGIRGANKILPARTFQLQLHQPTEIHVGEPIDASLYTQEDKDALIEKVYTEMKTLVGE